MEFGQYLELSGQQPSLVRELHSQVKDPVSKNKLGGVS